MIRWLRSSWVSRLPSGRRGSSGAGNAARTWSSKKWANGPWPTSWSRPAIRSVSTTRPSDGIGSPGAATAPGPLAGSGRATAPTDPASCMTPRPWVKRECSAVGKTQRALWSWLIRRRRWSHAVSSRSSSATSSSGRPAASRLVGGEPLGQLDVPVDRVADEVDRGERVAPHRVGQGTQIPRGCVHAPTLPRRSVARTRRRSEWPWAPVAQGDRASPWCCPGSSRHDPPSTRNWTSKSRKPGGVGLEPAVGAGPGPADVVTRAGAVGHSRRSRRCGPGLGQDHRAVRPAVGRPQRQPDADVVEAAAHQQRPVRGAASPRPEERLDAALPASRRSTSRSSRRSDTRTRRSASSCEPRLPAAVWLSWFGLGHPRWRAIAGDRRQLAPRRERDEAAVRAGVVDRARAGRLRLGRGRRLRLAPGRPTSEDEQGEQERGDGRSVAWGASSTCGGHGDVRSQPYRGAVQVARRTAVSSVVAARVHARRCVAATSSRSSGGAEDLDLVAPRQDPQPDLDRPGDGHPERERPVRLAGSSVWLGCHVVSPTRAATVGEKRRTTSVARLVRDDVPGPPERRAPGRPAPAARTSAA